MNLKYEWINTLFIILPLSLCVFIIVDIAYNERIWELDTFAVKARLQALGITVASLSTKAKMRRKQTGKNTYGCF